MKSSNARLNRVQKGIANRFLVEIRFDGTLRNGSSSGQLQQVVMNLVQNAADATEGMCRNRSGDFRASAGWRGRDRVSIADPGSHRQPGQAFRTVLSTKPVGRGTGLGLAIATASSSATVALTVENHPSGGGLFRLKSASGDGLGNPACMLRVAGR
ncbi:MAG: hypothetical protein IPP84_15225 [Propionivibrio sp.]|uniref:ATP-binding protein n=1 Tax=Propionivibrio sp. TaxID=2212460 RepID=UPI0025CC59F3|nr:ATP-binding protein [Propionivibrio sp.]MBL0209231.1 hypothetical protein [Propionivibrio sp.]